MCTRLDVHVLICQPVLVYQPNHHQRHYEILISYCCYTGGNVSFHSQWQAIPCWEIKQKPPYRQPITQGHQFPQFCQWWTAFTMPYSTQRAECDLILWHCIYFTTGCWSLCALSFLVRLALDLVDWHSPSVAVFIDTVSWLIRHVKSSQKWPIMCRVGR